eukprot:11226641-Lingulodinium_polyedra.AAC.1
MRTYRKTRLMLTTETDSEGCAGRYDLRLGVRSRRSHPPRGSRPGAGAWPAEHPPPHTHTRTHATRYHRRVASPR